MAKKANDRWSTQSAWVAADSQCARLHAQLVEESVEVRVADVLGRWVERVTVPPAARSAALSSERKTAPSVGGS